MEEFYKLELDDGSVVYQHVVDWSVVDYVDAAGTIIYTSIPTGIGSKIIAGPSNGVPF